MGKKDNDDTVECVECVGRSPFEYEYEKYLIKEMKKQKKEIKKLQKQFKGVENYLDLFMNSPRSTTLSSIDETAMVPISDIIEKIDNFRLVGDRRSVVNTSLNSIVKAILFNDEEDARKIVKFEIDHFLSSKHPREKEEPWDPTAIPESMIRSTIRGFHLNEFTESPEDPLIREIVTAILLNADEEEVRKTVAKNLHSLLLLMNDNQKKGE